jgi:hypothetical protein
MTSFFVVTFEVKKAICSWVTGCSPQSTFRSPVGIGRKQPLSKAIAHSNNGMNVRVSTAKARLALTSVMTNGDAFNFNIWLTSIFQKLFITTHFSCPDELNFDNQLI